jgi:hypothetical protein
MSHHPPQLIEEAFQIWSTAAGRNDTRTAALLGLPQTTVSSWRRTHRWDARDLATRQDEADRAARHALAQMRAGMPVVAERLLAIATARRPVLDAEGRKTGAVYASQDRDAIQAAKLLAQYGLDERLGDGLPEAIEAQVSFPLREEDLAALSVGELRAETGRMIEATAQAVNTRPSRRRNRV